MSAQPQIHLSPEEYLAIERSARERGEYADGERVAMAGGSRRHNLIATNLVRELSLQLKGEPCEVYSSDQRVLVPATSLYTYPDVVVACGEPRFEDEELDTLLDPTLIFEILSPTTESYDRGAKATHYRHIDSLREYLLVAQDEIHVERFSRRGESSEWLFTELTAPDAILELASIDCALPLAEIYDRLEL